MAAKAEGRNPNFGDDLIEALTEIQDYLRGEAVPEWYQIDDALLKSQQPVRKRKKQHAVNRR